MILFFLLLALGSSTGLAMPLAVRSRFKSHHVVSSAVFLLYTCHKVSSQSKFVGLGKKGRGGGQDVYGVRKGQNVKT